MRRIALVTVLAFGCATVQPPQPGSFGPVAVPRIALAEPELELWIEGTRPVDPQEAAQTLEQSREALSLALADRGLEDIPDPEKVLVVRARAISVTSERKSKQVWSVVGIVVGIAVVITAIVLMSRGRGGGGGSRGSVGKAGYAPAVAAGRGGVGFRGPGYVPRRYAPPPPIGLYLGLNVAVPVGPSSPYAWPQTTESLLADRGWFDGSETEITVELADPRTGEVTWRRILRAGVDPRDPAAVSDLVDRALSGQPFGWKLPPGAVPAYAPPVYAPPVYAPPADDAPAYPPPGDAAPPYAAPPYPPPPAPTDASAAPSAG
jgi:hypothetical protein